MMKNILTILLVAFASNVFAQIAACEGDNIVLHLPSNTRGNIQWQRSIDLTNWAPITNATNDTLQVTLTQGTEAFRAQILEGTCAAIFSDVEQFLTTPAPSPANAGPNQTVGGTSASLSATPPLTGAGLWSILNGTGGVVVLPTDPASTFTGTTGTTYSLLWTVSTGANCPNNTDTVEISFQNTASLPTITCNSAPLYVHPTDNSGPMAWGCSGVVSGATDDNNGQLNTSTIIVACTAPTAAHLCDNLTAFGFSDWYLPAYNELECLRQNGATIGGFQAGSYWSSTEGTLPLFSANARYRTFPSGVSGYGSKSNLDRVRCVRK